MSAATDPSRIGPTTMTRAATSSELQAAVAPALPPEEPRPARTVFGELLLLRPTSFRSATGRIPSIAIAEELGRALRGALLRHADDPPPAVLSGHYPDGRALDRPHAAFLTLPDLRSGSGTVAAAAIALPRDIELSDLQAILLAAARWERSGTRLWLGRLGEITFERVEPGEADLTPWVGPAKLWASVTPVVLDRNPGNLRSHEPDKAARAVAHAEETVANACGYLDLPRPATVRVRSRSPLHGIPAAHSFRPFPARGGSFRRFCIHSEVVFAEPVGGPIMLGVGRYFGVGLLAQVVPPGPGAARGEDEQIMNARCRREAWT